MNICSVRAIPAASAPILMEPFLRTCARTQLLTAGSEALDLASAPVLDEVAQAVSDDVPILPETLPLTPTHPLSSASVMAENSPGGSALPLSPGLSGPAHPASIDSALEHLSIHDAQDTTAIRGFGTPDKSRALSFGSAHRARGAEVSPPPSLSLSPSASGSPSSSQPASPMTSMHPNNTMHTTQYPASVVYGKTDDSSEEEPRRMSFVR